MQKSSRRSFLKYSVLSGLVPAFIPFTLHASAVQQRITKKSPQIERGLVFLFQGDSITDGNRGRTNDPNHIMGHGYAFSVASRIGADFPDMGFTFFNRGTSGNTLPDLQERWQTDTLDLTPDVLSILIGINDVAAVIDNSTKARSIEDFENIYKQLLQSCKDVNSNIIFVLGLPFVYPVGARSENYELWKEEVLKRGEVVRRLAGEYDAILVDYPAAFEKAMERKAPEYWIWDGIHPTIYGHEIMAREWINQLSTRFPFLGKYGE